MAHNHAKTLHQVEQESKLAGYSPRTVSSYLGGASRFLRFVDKPARRVERDCTSSPTEPHEDEIAKVEEDEELWRDEVERLAGEDPRRCPVCGEGTLVLLEAVPSRDELNLRSARAPP